jgi:hypothetical protein
MTLDKIINLIENFDFKNLGFSNPRINEFWIIIGAIATTIFVCIGSFIIGGGF